MKSLVLNNPLGGSGESSATSVNRTAVTMSQETAGNPRFLVIKKTDGTDFSRVSPFLIHKAIYGLIGEVKMLKKTFEGLLVETTSSAQSKRLLKVERLVDFPVTVSSHISLNSSKGVIYCRDLLNCSITEIEENLKENGVIGVKRIQVRREGILVDSPNLILTFNTSKLPKYINAAMYRLEVRPFIPNPIRCFRCQQFGHTSARCKKDEICTCGKPKHEGSPCETPVCVNCKGDHFAQDKGCPKYKEESAIQKIKVIENIDYREAKKRVTVNTPTPGITYAQSVQSNIKGVINELIPEIVKICTSLIKEEKQSAPVLSTRKTTLSKFKTLGPLTRSVTSDKRTAEDSDESEDIQSSSSQIIKTVKRKPGRPPKSKAIRLNPKTDSEIESLDPLQRTSSREPNI